MREEDRITEEELQAELDRLNAEAYIDSPGYTRKQLQRLWGLCEQAANRRIARMIDNGELVQEGTREERTVTGKTYRAPCYRPNNERKTEEK